MSAGAAKPESMGDLPQWVCWRADLREGRATKVPYSPGAGSRARSDDPATWGTLPEAKKGARDGDLDGIGFVFTASDPFCGVDLDACVDPKTNEIASWASEIVRELDSYTEFSPSGAGLHVLLRAKLPPGGNRRSRIEIYDRGRFFTVTGRRLGGTSQTVEERQGQLSALHSRLFSPREPEATERRTSALQGRTVPDGGLDDDEVLRKAASAANGPRFSALWAGDRSGYTSDSEADLALCSMLAFWVGQDGTRISSLFSRSGLMREKWDREDYRRRTISRAISRAEFYTPAKDKAVQPSRNGHHRDANNSLLPTRSTPPAPFPVDAMPPSCRPLIEEATAAKPPQVRREEIRPLTPEQVKMLLEAASGDRLEGLYTLAVHTGLRQGELLGLKWEDVDLESGSLHVKRTLATARGGPRLAAPKTKGSRRRVSLVRCAVDALRAHLARQLEEIDRAGSLWQENGLVFASELGEPLDRRDLASRRFKPLLKRAKLSEKTRFHDLRHTCATLLLTKNVNPKVVSEMLGHSNIAITLDTYSHVLPNMQDSAARALEEALR